MLLIYYFSAILGMLAGNMFNYTSIILSQSISESDAFSGWVFFFICMPLLFLSFPAGNFLDRYSRKWVLAFSQLTMALSATITVIGLEYGWIGVGKPYLLLLPSFLTGIGLAFAMPGRFAILGDILDHSKIGTHSVWMNTFVLFGYGLAPLIAGSLKEFLPFKQVFIGIVVSYLLSATLLIFLPISTKDRVEHTGTTGITAVFTYLKNSILVRQFLQVMGSVVLLVGPVQILLPKYAKEILHLNEASRGALLTVLGIGLVIGGTATFLFHSFRRKGHILFGLSFFMSLLFAGLPFFSSNLFVTSFLLFLFGLFTGVVITLIPAGIQQNTENFIRGRILSVYSLVFLLVPAITGVIAGFISDRIGISATFVWAGFMELGSLVYMSWRMGEVRKSF
ncbi:MFS transporter [Leptospira perolatii]|uniref:MFS transporter n=1 Tax=Leptospira perolatii TaxID=2023191 RepID=A0A2M9ZK92_9LEPT|nr:MFS transporter [Leptospira perolatii]PJZ69224.1 MFS transporter [Leptospira perolatii]PJZ72394.1 MFS transporter [Leptospira perolatii]